MASPIDIGNIKEQIRSILDGANTTTGSPIDLSLGMTSRVQNIMKVNPEKLKLDVNLYPCLTVFIADKSIELTGVAVNQASAKRKCEITFNIAGFIYSDLTSDFREDSADEECEILMENVEAVLRSYDTLNSTVTWHYPTDVTYHNFQNGEETHMRVGLMSLKASIFY